MGQTDLTATRWQISRDMTVKLLKPHPTRYNAQEGWGIPTFYLFSLIIVPGVEEAWRNKDK